jgi:cell wall assembly regulator SMI1
MQTPPAEKTDRPQDYTALLARLESWLSKHRPHFLHDLVAGASAAELDALQAQIGMALPAGLRTLLHWHNGQRAEAAGSLIERWRLMSCMDIAAAKKEQDAPATRSGAGWQTTWIPFLDDDDGDYVCLDTSQPDLPVREFWLDKTTHPIVSPSLARWLEDFVTAVERGEYVEDPERGDFMKRRN